MKTLICLVTVLASGLLLLRPDENGPFIQIGAKGYVQIHVENVGDTVSIRSSYWPLLTFQQLFTSTYEISSDSSCLLTFDIAVPTRYNLSLDKDVSIPVFVIPGDTLTIKVDYRQHKNKPVIGYEGANAQINQYLYEKPEAIAFDKEGAQLFNDPGRLETPEKTLLLYKHRSDSMLAVQHAYIRAKSDSFNLPSWFVEYEEIESALFVRYHQLIIADYWNIFFQADLDVPDDYFDHIGPIDVNNPNALYSFFFYLYLPVKITKSPEFLQYKNRFLDSCGVKNVEELKATKAYSAFYLKQSKYVIEKADELLPNESLHPFVTHYFFHTIKLLDRVEREQLLHLIAAKLKDTAFLPFMLSQYQAMSLHLSPGEDAPDFYLLSDEKDKYLSVGDFKGKAVLLNFWFPGCKPCLYEIPHERDLVKRFGDKGFALVNICMKATVEQWQTALKKFDLHGTNVVTQGNWETKLTEAYAIDGFPHYVLLDREGKIVENKTHKPSDARLSELIEATLRK